MKEILAVVELLKAFDHVKSTVSLSESDKKVIARDILRNIPPEIVAPQAAESAKVLSDAIRTYLGVTNGRTEKPKAESPIIAEPDAPESPKEPEATGVVGGPRVASGAHRTNVKAPRGGKANRGS